ncbi:MAG: hypothetical protein R2849_12955 [Thermomicrobiales bacterium]
MLQLADARVIEVVEAGRERRNIPDADASIPVVARREVAVRARVAGVFIPVRVASDIAGGGWAKRFDWWKILGERVNRWSSTLRNSSGSRHREMPDGACRVDESIGDDHDVRLTA